MEKKQIKSLRLRLQELSEFSYKHTDCLISSTVVDKKDNMPENEFYESYKNLKGVAIEEDKKLDIFVNEANKVFNYSKCNDFIKILEKNI